MSESLKPCPFCGGKAQVRGDDFAGRSCGYCVVCLNPVCYCALGEGYDRDSIPDHCFATEEQAIAAWNKREVKE